jgi:flagellar protein FliO/FliZ
MIGVIAIAHKMNGLNLQNVGMYRYAKILEKVGINKDTYLMVLKTGEDGCVLLVSSNNIEKIKDLTPGDIKDIESNRQNNNLLKADKFKFNKLSLKKDVQNPINLIGKLKEKKDANIK